MVLTLAMVEFDFQAANFRTSVDFDVHLVAAQGTLRSLLCLAVENKTPEVVIRVKRCLLQSGPLPSVCATSSAHHPSNMSVR